MKKIILAFHHLIVLIWLILVIVIFKITTNFKFSNGNSLIFLALIITFPTFIYIFTAVSKKKLKNKLKQKRTIYFDKIKDDIKKSYFKDNLLNKIDELGLKYKLIENEKELRINISMKDIDTFNLTFTEDFAVLQLYNTIISFSFYYSNYIGEYSKYDIRNFEYKETKVLYLKILEKITSLINRTYIYFQSNKLVKLTDKDTNEVVYEIKLNKKLFLNLKKIKKIIEL